MTWEELEKGIQEIKDQNLVTARLLELHGRQSNQRFERLEELALHQGEQVDRIAALALHHDERMDRIVALALHQDERLDRIEELALRHEERFRETEAALRALIETVDRFLRGRQGNGQKGQQ